MNKLCCLIIMFITCGVCKAQNFVPNGNFEQYSGCPTLYSQLDSALFWHNPTQATPDYFNQCSNLAAGVPVNYFGYQYALSGLGYSGITLFFKMFQNYREYIEVGLLTPLVANQCYHFEMKINLANSSNFTTDAIGVYFSNTLINVFTTSNLSFTPQISNITANYPDTINWQVVSGNYTAAGGENYLVIGNFKTDFNTDTILVNNTGYVHAYVYIDDVCLTQCGSSCTTGINEQIENTETKIYPNPFSDAINFSTKDKAFSEIILYDITSRKLFQQSFANSTSINTEQLAKGIYLYEVRNKNGVIKKGKVVKD